MKAAMNSHVAQERHTMFQSSAENVKNRLSVMLKELEVYMNNKADEVYIAMRRDYNSVLGGGDVPQNGELLPKTQRLVRKEMMRIIDAIDKVFEKIAGLEVKEEDDEDINFAHGSDGEDGSHVYGKKEEDEDTKLQREAGPSGQLENYEPPKQDSSSDERMADAGSDRGSNTKLKSEEDSESFDGLESVKSGDSDGSESFAGSESS